MTRGDASRALPDDPVAIRALASTTKELETVLPASTVFHLGPPWALHVPISFDLWKSLQFEVLVVRIYGQYPEFAIEIEAYLAEKPEHGEPSVSDRILVDTFCISKSPEMQLGAWVSKLLTAYAQPRPKMYGRQR